MAESQEVPVSFEYAGREFDFRICQRELTVGVPSKVLYYWMNSAQLRQGTGGPNFRPCVDLWWHVAEQEGQEKDLDNLANLVLAECYPLINTSKGMQDVYVDAQLSRTADRDYSFSKVNNVRMASSVRTHQLSTDECQRLREIAFTRDWTKIRSEFEQLFLGEQPSEEELPAFNEAAQSWIGNGIVEFKKGGHQGLQNYAATLDEWIVKLRKQGQIERVHRFLNRFSHTCKIAFYTCYCSAWVGILQWLEHNCEPNVVGDRLMRLWHNQNRGDHSAENKSDVFHGQVLALHPLSGIMHSSPEHLTTIGQWFGHREYDSIMSAGKAEKCDEYWSLVGSILIAAHEYSGSRNRCNEFRDQVTQVSSETVSGAAIEDTNLSMNEAFEHVAAEGGHKCSKCAEAVTYIRHEPPDDDNSTVTVDFECTSCGNPESIQVSFEAMQKSLKQD